MSDDYEPEDDSDDLLANLPERPRPVAKEQPCEGVEVSTILMGRRLQPSGVRRPLWETLVFGGLLDGCGARDTSEDDAMRTNLRWCAACVHAQAAEKIIAEAKAMGEGP